MSRADEIQGTEITITLHLQEKSAPGTPNETLYPWYCLLVEKTFLVPLVLLHKCF